MNSCSITTLPKPCPSCPWRVDQTASDIPNFDIEKAEGLAECCPDHCGASPAFDAPIFSCHQSKEGAEFPCAGWLATVGHRHPRMRYRAMLGDIPFEALEPGKDWPELHENYGDVLDKLRDTA